MPKIILILTFLCLSGCLQLKKDNNINGQTMGTSYSINVLEDDRINQQEIENRLIEINSIFSNWQENSEISKLNNAKINQWIPVSKELFTLLEESKNIYNKTDKFFDPGIGHLINLWGFGTDGGRTNAPTREQIKKAFSQSSIKYLEFGNQRVKKLTNININLSAIAKGYAVDEISRLIESRGIKNFLVEIGGEIYASGLNNNKKWQIGIEMPDNTSPIPIAIVNSAIATSGNYRNYFVWEDKKYTHIFNPKTGMPVNNDIISVSIINKRSAIADAYATAMMAMGSENAISIVKKLGLSALFIIKTKNDYEIIKINL